MRIQLPHHFLYAILCCFCLLNACRNNDVDSLQLNEIDKFLSVGDSLQLGYTKVEPENMNFDITWTSSNNAVATVDAQGLIVAHAEGEAVITSHVGKESASCNIHVVTYGFKNAVIFDTQVPNRFKLILSTKPAFQQQPVSNSSNVSLVLDVLLPADSTNIVTGLYSLKTDEQTVPPYFFAGLPNQPEGSFFLFNDKKDTLFVNGGQFNITNPEKYLIIGELTTSGKEDKALSFIYEGTIPIKNTLKQ